MVFLIYSDLSLILLCLDHCHSSFYQFLILDVYDKYNTSGVILLSYENDDAFEWRTFVQTTVKYLSNYNIISTIKHIESLEDEIKLFRYRIDRPMVVVFLEKIEHVKLLETWCQKVDMGYPVWLFLFTGLQGTTIYNYYKNVNTNTFSLKFNTELIVWCCQHPRYIYEWWTIDGKNLKRRLLGIWQKETGLVFTSNRSLYDRRGSLHGLPLRITFSRGSAFFYFTNNTLDGYMGEIVTELQYAMNFSINKLIENDRFGIWNDHQQKWTGMVGVISRQEADLGVGELSMTNDRREIIDFTLPLYISPCRIYFKQMDNRAIHLSAYFKAFSVDIWISILIIIAISPLLLVTMREKINIKPVKQCIVENYLLVWGIFCQQSIPEFPSKMSLAVAYFSIFITSIVISATYSAAITSYLAVSDPPPLFSSVEEFIADGTYELSVLQDGANYDLFTHSEDPVMKELRKIMVPRKSLPKTNNEGFLQLCYKKVAFYANDALKKSVTINLPCEIGFIETGKIDSIAMILPHNSSYTGLINYQINRFRDNGVLRRLKRRYLHRSLTISELNINNSLDIQGAAPVFLVIAGGLCTSALVFMLEKIHFLYFNKFLQWFFNPTKSSNLNIMNKFDNIVNYKVNMCLLLRARYSVSLNYARKKEEGEERGVVSHHAPPIA
ncbi:glutamate receptor ionotropic, kainate 2-like [Chelonus insularis]|uniref:glutamate receptor ionotropic, kainate 2-like n=1 Tax=Chelonus insularis TaxID=460826 RepID=UPI00158993CA|nr:glutamate receptor ionotropic, kainate 2-like [Chelonus insularis]